MSNDQLPPFSTRSLNLYFGNYTSSVDRDVTASFNVFNGRSSFVLRRKGQASPRPMASVNVGPEQLLSYIYVADVLAAKGPKTNIKSTISVWDKETSKYKDNGIFVLGINDKYQPFFGVNTADAGQQVFVLRLANPSLANDELLTKDQVAAITIKSVCENTRQHLTMMEVLTNEKRNFNRNGGGGNSGGNSSYSKPAAPSTDDDLGF